MTQDQTYNGWANWETWNVALWIGNDEWLYHLARDCKRINRKDPYKAFVESLQEMGGEIALQTPDGCAWNDSGIDTDELNEMIEEL